MSASNLILVLNCGSSSVKFSVIDPKSEESFLSGLAEKLGLADAYITFKYDGKKDTITLKTNDHVGALESIIDKLKELWTRKKKHQYVPNSGLHHVLPDSTRKGSALSDFVRIKDK